MEPPETGKSADSRKHSVRERSDRRWVEEQRELVQEALLEGEERLQALLNDCMAAIYLKDLDGRYLMVNRWADIMFRITREEALGKTDHELWPKEVADALRANDLEALKAESPLRFEQRFLHEEGEYTYKATKFPLYDSAGDLYAVCGIAIDVTERKRAEDKAEESEERFRALVQNSSDVVTVLDAGGAILYVSPAIESVLGYRPEDRVGGNAFDHVHPDDAERVKGLYARAANDFGGIGEPQQFRMLHADGSWRYVETIRNNLLEDPSVRGIVVNLRDVTERKEAEVERTKSEEKYRGIFENAVEGIYQTARDGRLISVNPTVASILGYASPEETIERLTDVEQLYVDPDRRGEFVDFMRENDLVAEFESRVYRKDGSIAWISESARAVRDAEGTLLYYEGFLMDITERKEAEEALKASEERYRRLVENSPETIAIISDQKIAFINAAGAKLGGVGGPEDLVGKPYLDFVHPDYRGLARSRISQAREGNSVGLIEQKLVRPDGRILDVEAMVIPTTHEGKPAVQSLIRDITERKKAEEALRESEERYRAVMEQSADGIWLFDLDTKRLLEFNESFHNLLGYEAQELDGMSIYDFIAHDPEDIDAVTERNVQEKRRFLGERKYRRKDGSLIHVEVSANVIPYHGREVMCGVARNVTRRKALEERLKHQAFYDPLTELPNRALFLDRLGHALAQMNRLKESVAVLFVDLDDFKVVNDSLGHDAGNALLVGVAERLRGCVRPGDTVARLFGDEFAVLLEAPAELDHARQVTERIGEHLQKPCVVDGQEAFVSASIGIALSDSAGDQPKDVLRRADLAMYTAKRRRKARYEVFQPSMDTRAMERLDLENQLRRAMEREEFEVHYQPVIDIGSGEINGLEALARWRHPERGMVFPGEFIVLAEETGLIRPMGRWVLQEACRQAVKWRERYLERRLLMSVNLSTSQFSHQPDLIAQVIEETGMDPRDLQLEITERVVMDDAEFSLGKLQKLKGLGVRFAIDDYGTGYSCLYYLKRMPVSLLKIDQTFIAGVGSDKGDEAIVAGTVSLAHALGLKVVAEGVETAGQLAKLEELGCDMVQGFYFSRPLPSEAIESLLDKGL